VALDRFSHRNSYVVLMTPVDLFVFFFIETESGGI
jgi:hypothetical protein